MAAAMSRLEFMKMMGVGGLVFASGLPGLGAPAAHSRDDFFFLQLSDTHWGFKGDKANPDAAGTLPKAIEAVNSLKDQPEFLIFTGDLTHDTEDAALRRRRMDEFKAFAAKLKVKKVLFLPGEHDAGQDRGAAYREKFGESHYAFNHKGIHFIALDNVSQEGSTLGKEQLRWLQSEVDKVPKAAPLVVFAHRPLFDLYPDWDWTTADGGEALAILAKHPEVTVFYGHIHQEHNYFSGNIGHHAATSLIFPLPAPASQPKRSPVPWEPAEPYRGLGFRQVREFIRKRTKGHDEDVIQWPLDKFIPKAVS